MKLLFFALTFFEKSQKISVRNAVVKVLLFTFISVLPVVPKRVNIFNPLDFHLLKAQNIGYK